MLFPGLLPVRVNPFSPREDSVTKEEALVRAEVSHILAMARRQSPNLFSLPILTSPGMRKGQGREGGNGMEKIKEERQEDFKWGRGEERRMYTS